MSVVSLKSEQVRELRRRLLAFYQKKKRDLPWRRTSDPYRIWLSEVMLQQTRVDTVIPYYARFLATFPTVHALADAPLDRVLAEWSGLGYYRRARMLHAAAQQMAAGDAFPNTRDGLLEVKGIGPYTAGAVASIAFGESVPLVDGNVARVFARLFAIDKDIKAPATMKTMWQLAEGLVPRKNAGDWNQALMELGATVCVPREPRCGECPLQTMCAARIQGRERELPLVAKKGAVKSQHLTACFIAKGHSILMLRRVENARFGGLWELPTVEGENPRGQLSELLRGEVNAFAKNGEFIHVLSHRRLHVDVVTAKIGQIKRFVARGDYGARGWVTLADLEARGVSRLTRKALEILRKKGLLR